MIEIRIPKLGLTMENAVVAAWHVPEGAEVHRDDLLLTIETDKLTFDIPAPGHGWLVRAAAEGEVCAVEAVVGYLAGDREEYRRLRRRPPAGGAAPGSAAAPRPAAGPAAQQPPGGRVKTSPLARSMAAERGLDLSRIRGSGPGGRIVRADILRAAGDSSPASGASAPGIPNAGPVLRRIPITGARRRIYESIYHSMADTAQFSLHTDADAGALQERRRRLRDEGLRISYNAMLIKIAAAALRRHPNINAGVARGNEILVWKNVNIGLAMHIDGVLMVPVFRSADSLSLRQINTRINACMRRIKRKRLSPDELTGGTFTITNLGFADVDHFTPILRAPESAVLGVGRIVEKPVAAQGRIAVRPMVGLSLTVDHRIIDGAPAARFLHTVKQMVENPDDVLRGSDVTDL